MRPHAAKHCWSFLEWHGVEARCLVPAQHCKIMRDETLFAQGYPLAGPRQLPRHPEARGRRPSLRSDRSLFSTGMNGPEEIDTIIPVRSLETRRRPSDLRHVCKGRSPIMPRQIKDDAVARRYGNYLAQRQSIPPRAALRGDGNGSSDEFNQRPK